MLLFMCGVVSKLVNFQSGLFWPFPKLMDLAGLPSVGGKRPCNPWCYGIHWPVYAWLTMAFFGLSYASDVPQNPEKNLLYDTMSGQHLDMKLWWWITDISHDGSMVLPYMVTWIPLIYPSHVSIYQHHGSVMGYIKWGTLRFTQTWLENPI